MNCNLYGNIIISNDSFVNIEPASLKTFGGYIDGKCFVSVIIEKLDEDKRAAWLEEKGYTAEDMEDVSDSEDGIDRSTDNTKFSRNIDNYTEKQYNDFGWVRTNEILTASQYENFTTNFADAVHRKHVFPKAANGEWIIPTHDGINGADNALVFAGGAIKSPKITKIIFIHSNNGSQVACVSEVIYENESNGIQAQTSELFTAVEGSDYTSFQLQKDNRQSNRDSNRSGTDGAGSSGAIEGTFERSKKVKFSREDDEITEKDIEVIRSIQRKSI